MKKILPFILAFIASGSIASAALLNYDGIDYTAGDSLLTQNGGDPWSNLTTWYGAGGAVVTAGSLTGTDATLSTTGNHAVLNNTSRLARDVGTLYTDATTQSVWMSFIFDVNAVNTYSAFELYNASTLSSANRSFQVGSLVGDTGFGSNFSMRINNTTSVDLGASTIGSNFFVARFDLVDGGNDTVSVWVNPTQAALSGAATGTATIASMSFERVAFADFGGAVVSFDEVRVGSTLSDVAVIPEPSAYSLIAGFLALGWIMVRRRR